MPKKSPQKDALERLEMNFYGRGVAEKWRRFIEEAKFTDETKGGKFPAARFVALPRKVQPEAFYLTGSFHPTGPKGKKNGDVHWHMTVLRCPETEPPERMVTTSKQIGGTAGFWKRMAELWPDAQPVQVETSGTFDVSDLQLKMPGHDPEAGKFSASVAGKEGNHTLTPVVFATTWRVSPKHEGVTDVTIFGSKRGSDQAIVKGALTGRVEPTMIEIAQRQLWRSLSLFKP